MKKTTTPVDRSVAKKAPYRRPKLRSYGSIQAMTLATTVMSMTKDGAGGGGKTAV
jgi:hypothetical protein